MKFKIQVPLLLMTLLALSAAAWAQSGPSMSRFEGHWEGVCADGKPFVLLTLHQDGAVVSGTVEIANMKGAEGQCESVTDPPSKDHAMTISDSHLMGKTLSFQGSQNAKFELTTVGPNSARLKFLGTPVEENPWTLERLK